MAAPVEPDIDRVRAMCGRVLAGDFATEQHVIGHVADKALAALRPGSWARGDAARGAVVAGDDAPPGTTTAVPRGGTAIPLG